MQLLKNRICGGRPFERLAVGVVVSDELIDALHELLGGALPAELITPAVWSRIIGRVENESTPFLKNSFVRRKIKQSDRETGAIA